ncbi:MAG TPA: 3-oxoacyl-[acyl-carrier-protein] synthase III C-terminal domain-containing protein [Myxococcales bacterium]|jgi:3-oxoacyl-[acyl-carrier-protein] synthase-3
MTDSVVFAGFGGAVPAHKVTNAQLSGLRGLATERIEASEDYQALRCLDPGMTPARYFIERKMGFCERYHVAPFPPDATQRPKTTTVDLAAEAMARALADAGVEAVRVDAWVMSTVSGPVQAPDALTLAKRRLTGDASQAMAVPLHAGCGGFNLGLQLGRQLLRSDPAMRHVLVAHAETMSRFLRREPNLVPFATFGDGAACVVLARGRSGRAEGLLHVVNRQDPAFLDLLGVSADWELFMDAKAVKERALRDMGRACEETLAAVGVSRAEVDLFVPHQTGNAIALELARQLEIESDRVYLGAQARYGNVSGATVPMALWTLAQERRLRPGMNILSATAGVGGLYGAFFYRVPERAEAGDAVAEGAPEAGSGRAAGALRAD